MVCFWQKMCKNSLIRKIKLIFFQKTTFFESPITHKQFIFEQSFISYGNRQKSCILIVIFVILSYLTSPIFIRRSRQSRPDIFFEKEEVVHCQDPNMNFNIPTYMLL